MKRLSITALALLSFGAISQATLAADNKGALTFGKNACRSGETWSFSGSIDRDRANAFQIFLKGQRSPVVGFSEGLAYRRFADNDEARLFGEYWVSRALHEAKLTHVAWNGFSAMLARPLEPSQLGIQLSALSCLLEIQSRVPALEFTPAVATRISELTQAVRSMTAADLPAAKQIVQEAAGARIRELVADEKPSPKAVEPLLQILNGAGPLENFSQGIWAARRQDHRATITWMKKFLAAPAPQKLQRYLDHARILLGRAHFSTGEFGASLNAFLTVTRSSNELAQSLSDLAWAQLQEGRYKEAIGTSLGLRAGGLRNTFTPESPMIMSMALNEICQYPQSVQAMNSFKKQYENSHRWLSAWMAKPVPLYPKAIKFLASSAKGNKDPSAPPVPVASDWVRSPLFISFQDEINLLFDEKESSKSLARSGSEEQKILTGKVLEIIRELKPKLKLAKMKQKEGENLPSNIQAQLELLKQEMLRLRRLRQAAPIWRMILANHLKQVPLREAHLVSGINSDLTRRTRKMFYQIEEIAENLQLVEVEIYNGASQDIIWQNAHPDYKKVAAEFSEEKRSAQKVWDWGHVAGTSDDSESGEIWEDELGSFKAAVFDNCSSKDRYLALKMKRGTQ